MFDFLKKKKEVPIDHSAQSFYAVATGKVIPIDEVKDPVFSQKMMGDGYAVIPSSGDIYAPINGKVLSVFPTKHAIGLKMSNGLEILLHMGVDTVELNGDPFKIKVAEGDAVTPSTLVAKVDLEKLEKAEKSNEMIVIITNMDAVDQYELTNKGEVEASAEVGHVTVK